MTIPPSKVVIFGAYKTGTTGLFYKIASSLPEEPRTLFESSEYLEKPDDAHQWVLAKTILWYAKPERQPRYETFLPFQKQIYLTRDPRDWLVSLTLFMIQQEPSLYGDDAKLSTIIQVLSQKQRRPRSLSCLALLKLLNELSDVHQFDTTMDWMRQHYAWLPVFESRLDDYVRLKYEDFVENRLEPIEEHLGFSLRGSGQVPAELAHVPRTLGKGNWADWFTEEDRDFFRPTFQDYMDQYGYADDWHLSAEPRITAEHSVDYVLRTVNRRRATPFAPEWIDRPAVADRLEPSVKRPAQRQATAIPNTDAVRSATSGVI